MQGVLEQTAKKEHHASEIDCYKIEVRPVHTAIHEATSNFFARDQRPRPDAITVAGNSILPPGGTSCVLGARQEAESLGKKTCHDSSLPLIHTRSSRIARKRTVYIGHIQESPSEKTPLLYNYGTWGVLPLSPRASLTAGREKTKSLLLRQRPKIAACVRSTFVPDSQKTTCWYPGYE